MPANKDDMVMVIGPVDTAPGKKAIYKPRQMTRRLAEKKSVKRLGIQIVTDIIPGWKPGDKVEADTNTEAKYRVADKDKEVKRGRKANAEKALEALQAEHEAALARLAELEKKNVTNDPSTDADQV